MKKAAEHPEDLSPYLQGEISDPSYKEVRTHVEECSRCRDEIRVWRTLDDLFRCAEAEMEVPPFQWRRIEAQMQAPLPAGFAGRLRLAFQPWSTVWKAALATLFLGAMIVTGIGIRSNLEEKQLLLAISNYAEAESRRIAADANPFRVSSSAEKNPFDRSLFPDSGDSPVGRR